MKLVIKKEFLVRAVNDVIKAISPKVNQAILTGIKIVATEKVTLLASDTHISIERVLPKEFKGEEVVEIIKEGSIVLNAKFFSEIIRKLPKDEITIEVKKNFETIILSGKSSFSLKGLDPEEYPKLPNIEGKADFSLTASQIKMIVDQTAFCVSTSEARPILTGISLDISDGLIVTTTDSHRLSIKTVQVDAEPKKVVVPARSLIEFSKVLVEPEELVEIILTDTQILFLTPELKFYSRLLDGNYPGVLGLVPKTSDTDVTVNVKAFIEAIERCNLLAKDGKNHVVQLETKKDHFLLTSNNQEVGKVVEEVAAAISGDDTTISFSAKFMKSALQSFADCIDVTIKFSGAMRPFLVTSAKDTSLTQLILPVKTN